MKRIFNFSAGPSTLPLDVLEKAQKEFVNFNNTGMSLIEMSHRGKDYTAVHTDAINLVRELFNVPANYKILFLGGGASFQFGMIPMNLLGEGKTCDFTVTGTWAKKAYADAKKIGTVNVLYDGKDNNYASLPEASSLKVNNNSVYLHMTSNETIGGIQWHNWPETGNVPIVCDMSSDMLSRKVPIEKFGIIYAGAQKNLGPAGAALVIIRDDILAKCNENLTAYLTYKNHVDNDSMYNTPPVFSIYMIKMVLEWIKEKGGLEWVEKNNSNKAQIIYNTIDSSNGYYRSPVSQKDRSLMNIVFRLPTEDLEKKFIAEATEKGMSGLKGHRSVGGCRASVYNAMPVEGCETLAKFMNEFMNNNK